MKPFKHNTIQAIRLLYRTYYSNLIEPFKHNTIQGILLLHRTYYSVQVNRLKVFIYHFEATNKHVLAKLTYTDSKPFSTYIDSRPLLSIYQRN